MGKTPGPADHKTRDEVISEIKSRAGVTETRNYSKNNGHTFGSDVRARNLAEGASELTS
jgi:hypothetical protein